VHSYRSPRLLFGGVLTCLVYLPSLSCARLRSRRIWERKAAVVLTEERQSFA